MNSKAVFGPIPVHILNVKILGWSNEFQVCWFLREGCTLRQCQSSHGTSPDPKGYCRKSCWSYFTARQGKQRYVLGCNPSCPL